MWAQPASATCSRVAVWWLGAWLRSVVTVDPWVPKIHTATWTATERSQVWVTNSAMNRAVPSTLNARCGLAPPVLGLGFSLVLITALSILALMLSGFFPEDGSMRDARSTDGKNPRSPRDLLGSHGYSVQSRFLSGHLTSPFMLTGFSQALNSIFIETTPALHLSGCITFN